MSSKKISVLLLLSLVSSIPVWAQESGATDSFWPLQLLGRLHPMIVHFPIALLLVAVVMELFTLGNFRHSFRPAIRFLVILGAISALGSAGLGWLLAENEGISGSTLDLDRILGLSSAGLSFFLLVLLNILLAQNRA